MQSYLPKTQKGFTLIELMVVISIIAILSAIAITIFTGSQKNARDGVRRSDIDAIAKALESNKSPTSPTYPTVSANWFSKGVVPTSPSSGQYCFLTNDTAVPTDDEIVIDISTRNCAGTVAGGYAIIDGAATDAKFWKLCALLEDASKYCQSSTQ